MISELDRNLIALHVIADALTQMADAMQRDNDETEQRGATTKICIDGSCQSALSVEARSTSQADAPLQHDADDDTPPDGPKGDSDDE